MSRNLHCMLIDGANIDGVLGGILGHQPESRERPRWDKVIKFNATPLSPDGRKAHFFIAVDGETIPSALRGFLASLRYAGIKPHLLKREGERQVVDEAIEKALVWLCNHEDKPHILLLSHDGGYVDTLKKIREQDPERVIAVLGFPEFLASRFDEVKDLRRYDIERKVEGGFTYPLPRDLPTAIDDWTPDHLLD